MLIYGDSVTVKQKDLPVVWRKIKAAQKLSPGLEGNTTTFNPGCFKER
jgi:hypothetical protein